MRSLSSSCSHASTNFSLLSSKAMRATLLSSDNSPSTEAAELGSIKGCYDVRRSSKLQLSWVRLKGVKNRWWGRWNEVARIASTWRLHAVGVHRRIVRVLGARVWEAFAWRGKWPACRGLMVRNALPAHHLGSDEVRVGWWTFETGEESARLFLRWLCCNFRISFHSHSSERVEQTFSRRYLHLLQIKSTRYRRWYQRLCRWWSNTKPDHQEFYQMEKWQSIELGSSQPQSKHPPSSQTIHPFKSNFAIAPSTALTTNLWIE